jgi:hypothetical protein
MWKWNYEITDLDCGSKNDVEYAEVISIRMVELLNLLFKDGELDYDVFSCELNKPPYSGNYVVSFYCEYTSPTGFGLIWYTCSDYINFAEVSFRCVSTT